MADADKMTVGQIVDFCTAYNERQERIEKARKREEKHGRKRKATQADIDAWFS